MKKRIFSAILALAMIFALSACAAKTESAAGSSPQTTAAEYKILQERVIELTYSAFNTEKAIEYFNAYDPLVVFSESQEEAVGEELPAGGGCTAVKLRLNGDVYVGRNLDYYCTDAPAFVVRNNSGKYRTIAIGSTPTRLEPWYDGYEIDDVAVSILPFLCTDVMSEAGIYAEMNIRPYEEGMACVHTNEGQPRSSVMAFMQIMLSSYGSIDEILEHINDYDWFDMCVMGFEAGILLADQSGRSVIVEFAADSVTWEECDYNANFYINDDLYALETHGCGEMRLEREYSYLPYVRSEEDIYTMMKKGAYDQFYQADCDIDFLIPELYDLIGMDKNSVAADPELARELARTWLLEDTGTDLGKGACEMTWEERVARFSWETVFINTVNVSELYMNVFFSEHFNMSFRVEFD